MIYSGRIGVYKGRRYLFTHRDPKTGKIWSDDILVVNGLEYWFGEWVNPDEVEFV